MIRSGNKLMFFAGLIFVLSGYIFFVIQHHKNNPDPAFYSADSLYLPALAEDIITGTYDITGWVTPPAGCFFPDAAIMISIYAILRDVVAAVLLYGAIQYTFIIFGIRALFREIIEPHSMAILACDLTLVAGGIFPHLAARGWGENLMLNMSLSTHHAGTFLICIFSLILLLRYIRSPRNEILIILFIFAVLMIGSDKLFVIQFIVPGAAVALHGYIRKGEKKYAMLGTMAFMAVPAGYLFEKLIKGAVRIMILDYKLSERIWGAMMNGFPAIENFVRLMKEFDNIDYSFLFLTAIMIIAIQANSFLKYGTKSISELSEIKNAFTVFIISLFAINVPVVLAFSIYADFFSHRYLIPLYVLPVFSVPYIAARYRHKNISSVMPANLISVMMILISVFFVLMEKKRMIDVLNYRPLQSICLDELILRYKLKYGFSDYWNAKPLTIFSRAGTRVNQLNYDLTPRYLVNNYYWLYRDGKIPAPDYFITNELNRDLILEIAGRPRIIKRCGNKEIFIYGEGKNESLQNFTNNMNNSVKAWEIAGGRAKISRIRNPVD